MKTFCKLTAQSPAASYGTAAEVSSPRRSPAGHQQRREGTLCAAAGQSQRFPAERLRRAGRHDSAVLHLGTGASQTPPQPPERHTDLPGAGVQRLDRSAQAGLGQARPHYAELPSGRKADSAKRGWRNIARIKVESKVFSAPQALRKHRGISFPITPQKSVSMRLQKR